MNKSTHLRDASGKYAKSARQLNLHALLRKYGPGVIVVLFVAGGLWWHGASQFTPTPSLSLETLLL